MIKLHGWDEEYSVLRIICSFPFVRICLSICETTCLIDNSAKKVIVVRSVPDVCLFFSSRESWLHFRQSNGLSTVIKVRFMFTSASSVHLGSISHICPFSETHINQILFKVQNILRKKRLLAMPKRLQLHLHNACFYHSNNLRVPIPTYVLMRLCFLPTVMIYRKITVLLVMWNQSTNQQEDGVCFLSLLFGLQKNEPNWKTTISSANAMHTHHFTERGKNLLRQNHKKSQWEQF